MILKSLRTYFNNALLGYYPENEIESFFNLLSEKILKMKRVDIVLNLYKVVLGKKYDKFQIAIDRLKKYEPIQYILGDTVFCGLNFKVNNAVLIPRPETEELVDWIIKDNISKTSINILDIGTGSGCIPITLAKNLPNAKLYSVDISKDALKLAKENAKKNEVEVNFIKADILNDSLNFEDMTFDIIVSNPPYVRQSEKSLMKENVLNYEPHLALFVDDEDAFVFYKRIVELSDTLLKQEGSLYFEINEGLGEGTMNVMNNRFKNVELRKDINGKDRMIKGIRL